MRTLIVSDCEPLTHSARQILLDEGQEIIVAGFNQVEVSVKQTRPELIVVILTPNPGVALSRLGEIRVLSKASVLAVGPATDSKLVLHALRSGADDFLEEKELDQELRSSLARLRSHIQAPEELGFALAVLSPSGGGGGSTIAANLATLLAKTFQRVLLLDLKPLNGDAAALFNLKPVYTLSDLCRNISQIDKMMFERALLWHDSGVRILSGPRTPSEARQVNPEAVHQLMFLARVLFPYTVLDVDHTYQEEQLRALRDADRILIVFQPDFNSVRHVRQAFDILQEQGIGRERLLLVANRCGQAKELPQSAMEEALGVPIQHFLPDDPKTMNQANNAGVPAVLELPSAKVCKSLVALAARCLPGPADRRADTAPLTEHGGTFR